MEHNDDLNQEQEDLLCEEVRKPRPRWQRWLAGIALVLFLLVLTMYYINLFRGGA